MNTKMRCLLVLLLSCFSFSAFGQRGSAKLDAEAMKAFQYQCEALVKYYEETLNFLGDSATLPKDRQIVINDSYIKIFRDDEVQIEDDLISDRITVFYKDVKAYLRDVNFFYKNVAFSYHTQNVAPFYNDKGALCFKVTANRTLNGVNIKDETHEDNMVRYIEIEYNADKEDLKIVSIYTTELDETEDLAIWWSTLPDFWRSFLSKETILDGGVIMSDIISFSDTTISFKMDSLFLEEIKAGTVYFADIRGRDSIPYVLRPEKKVKAVKGKKPEPKAPDTLITILYPGKIMQPLVSKIIKQTELNMDGVKGFTDLAPVSKMSNLTYVSLRDTEIKDLNTLRNLNKLEALDISGTEISDLSPISFLIKLRELNASNTTITNLSSLSDNLGLASLNINNTKVQNIVPLSSLPAMAELHIDSTQVTSLSAIEKLTDLEVLTFNNTGISDIVPLTNLVNLKVVAMNETKVSDLSPCSNLKKLAHISFENTEITNLQGLNQLPELKQVYCDNVKASEREVLDFIYQNPATLVVFNTTDMETWWDLLTPYWKDYFSGRVGFYGAPNREKLAEIVALDHIDIANRKTVTDISCFNKVLLLQTLNASLSGVTSLVSLSNLPYLRKVDIGYTGISDISPLNNAQYLDTILANYTKIGTISSLEKMPALLLIECDNTNVSDQDVYNFKMMNPKCLIVYRSQQNTQWWSSLSPTWQKTFFNQEGTPSKYQLQEILNTATVDLTDNRSISEVSSLNSFLYLKRLILRGTMVSDLKPIANNKLLSYLDISNTPVTNIDMLGGLTALDSLNLENTQIKNFDILSSLTTLRYLDISGTPIKNLRPVAVLKNLEELGFSNTDVSSLDPLKTVLNLKKIRAFRTKVSERNITAFKQQNPNTEIIFY